LSLNRNSLLVVALAGIGLYFGGEFVWHSYVEGPLEQKQSDKEKLREKVQKKKKDLAKAKAAAKKLEVIERSSLPSDHEIARSLYRTWLVQLVEKSQFQAPHVESGPATSRKGFYESLGFSVRGKATLQNLVRFLFDFYRMGHLHRIQQLSLTPVGKTGNLDVIISIEGLILPGVERKDTLATGTSNRLHHRALADYAIISQRNIFGIGGDTDPSQQAYLTAVTSDNGEPEIWITLRGRDELMKLHIGGHFEIGQFSGTVIDILDNDVIFDSLGERWLISVGESLAEALPLPPEY
jgi:hypothetical protein